MIEQEIRPRKLLIQGQLTGMSHRANFMKSDSRVTQFLKYIITNGNAHRLTTSVDNNKMPIHRWFPFTAGFSRNLVLETFNFFKFAEDAIICDPFMGSGTTGVVGKELGVRVVGNESNIFLHRICKIKTMLEMDIEAIESASERLIAKAEKIWKGVDLKDEHPIFFKCYPLNNLKKLVALRELAHGYEKIDDDVWQCMFMAITMCLPKVSVVSINIPYIHWTDKKNPAETFSTFKESIRLIIHDIRQALQSYKNNTSVKVYLHDTRKQNTRIPSKSVDMIFTSPPYLNNLDYGEALKIYLYFWKIARNYSETTTKIRMRSVVAATTYYPANIARKEPEDILGESFIEEIPHTSTEIIRMARRIEYERLSKKRGKTFHLMTLLYFKDMALTLKEMKRVMKDDALSFIVMGDSALYGIHVETDKVLGKMAMELGFSDYSMQPIRMRGTKWTNLTYRHNYRLRESLLVLKK